MNEKIKLLWDKAVTLVEQEPDGDWSLDTIKDKFAKLIVRECAEQIIAKGTDEYDQYDMGQSVKAESIKAAIKQHFGVEP